MIPTGFDFLGRVLLCMCLFQCTLLHIQESCSFVKFQGFRALWACSSNSMVRRCRPQGSTSIVLYLFLQSPLENIMGSWNPLSSFRQSNLSTTRLTGKLQHEYPLEDLHGLGHSFWYIVHDNVDQ